MKTSRIALILLLTAFTPALSEAQEAQALQPAYINGTISVEGETISNVSISATFTYEGVTYNASTYVAGGNHYTLTVNVPAGVPLASYEINALAYVNDSNYISVPATTVDIAAGETKTQDAVVTPGYIEATVTAVNGMLDEVAINVPSGSATSTTGTIRIPVTPGPSIYLSGTATFSGPEYVALPATTVVVEPGQTVPVSWSVAAPDTAQ